jgi:hypothetical protein
MIIGDTKAFLRAHASRVVTISVLLLVPCFWHHRIEASDLASHTYNAWLAQLIARGQAPGLYIAPQATNVVFDIALARMGALTGLVAAEKILVSACVLIFFWGAFAYTSVMTERPPWFLAPALAMIAYGWTFSMGFMNFYLSVGLAFAAAAMSLRARGWEWILALLIAAAVFLAHVMGFVALIGLVGTSSSRSDCGGGFGGSCQLRRSWWLRASPGMLPTITGLWCGTQRTFTGSTARTSSLFTETATGSCPWWRSFLEWLVSFTERSEHARTRSFARPCEPRLSCGRC